MAKYTLFSFTALAAFSIANAVSAAAPADRLLPDTTVGFVSVPDVDLLRAEWDETQLGQLTQDPMMRPFVEDLQRQLRDKLVKTGVRLGLRMEDLDGVYGGEVCVAAVQPGRQPTAHAMVLVADVSGHEANARQLLDRIATEMVRRGARRSQLRIQSHEIAVVTMPKLRSEARARQAFYALVDDQLLATDHQQTMATMLGNIQAETSVLADVAAYRTTMQRCRAAAGQTAPHIRWYVDPFKYVQVMRAGSGGRRKRGTDMLKVLDNQGFSAVQALGGFVNLSTDQHEILHRTFVYAPAIERKPGDTNPDKYDLAARMLDFPNRPNLTPQAWMPPSVSSYVTFNWNMQNAFEHAKTLVNEIAGDEVFEDVLRGIKDDPQGPMVDIRQDVVAHLGERASMITHTRLPVTPKSERMLFAIELNRPDIVKTTVDKAMDKDPDAQMREFRGHIIWEILNQEETVEVEELTIDGLGDFDDEEVLEEEEDEPFLPNSAVTVANGHLIVATQAELIMDVLSRQANDTPLGETGDYQAVTRALENLGAADDSFRIFTRTDQTYRATYELVREGKMPESESALGMLLNRVLGPEEKDVLREQQIDGSKMPDFEAIRKYLGPAGAFVRSELDGWFVTGCLLKRQDAN